MKSHVIITILLASCLVGGVSLFSILYGKGGRGFFSPDTFQIKTQSEILLPPTEIPLYRSSFDYHREPFKLVAYLVAEGYWQPVQTDEPRWILMFHWNNQWHDGQTQLYHYMSKHPNEWIEWTEANRSLAAVLWPMVLSILRREISGEYTEEVMNLARMSSSVDEFRNYINNDSELQAKGISFQ